MVPGARALYSKLSLYAALDEVDARSLERLMQGERRELRRNADLVTQGETIQEGFVLLDGWAARYKTLPDGRRQILSFLAPGDLEGLFAAVSPYATYSVASLTRVSVAGFPPEAVTDVMARSPRLGAALAWAAAREHEIMAEHLVSVGRRSAQERVAHLFLELWARLRVRGLANGKRLSVPMTQVTIADTLGLSVVHVNRTLKQLARDGLLETRRDEVTILDSKRLQDIAGFDDDYLLHHYIPEDLRFRLKAIKEELEGQA